MLHFSAVSVPFQTRLKKPVDESVKRTKMQQHKSRESIHITRGLDVGVRVGLLFRVDSAQQVTMHQSQWFGMSDIYLRQPAFYHNNDDGNHVSYLNSLFLSIFHVFPKGSIFLLIAELKRQHSTKK